MYGWFAARTVHKKEILSALKTQNELLKSQTDLLKSQMDLLKGIDASLRSIDRMGPTRSIDRMGPTGPGWSQPPRRATRVVQKFNERFNKESVEGDSPIQQFIREIKERKSSEKESP